MNKKSSLFFLLTCICFFFPSYTQEQSHLSTTLITEVADMTDDIADIIINSKTDKDPQKTKSAIVKLIHHIANIAEAIITRKSDKKTRSVYTNSIYTDTTSLLDQEYVESLAEAILQKVQHIQSQQ